MRTTDLLGPSYYGVIGVLVDKYERETKIWPRTCHDVTVGAGTSYHSIVLRRYTQVRATGIMTKDTCRKDMAGPIIVQQGCDGPNVIKS